MIILSKSTQMSLQETEARAYKLVRNARDAGAKGHDYQISLHDKSPVELSLLGKSKFDALVANVDPAKSLPPKLKHISFDLVSAAARIEEIYHMVVPHSEFPGNTNLHDKGDLMGTSGFEHKIREAGSQLDNVDETLVALGGGVIASHSIASQDSISAKKAGGPLSVVAVNLNLGSVLLNDGIVPVADGVAVEMVYQTNDWLVIYLHDQKQQIIAVICSKALNDYLVANAL
jgi:hypothetical protein